MLRALLLAPPGAGKGTQGDRLADLYGVPHVATGDLLREHVANGTKIGREAERFMTSGELVPDDLVTSLVLERIRGTSPPTGFVLDGFPRTLSQAERAYEWALENQLTFHAAVALEVPTEELVGRLLARGKTSGRVDDSEDTIRRRLEVYGDVTSPLLDFYKNRGILVEVEGTGTVDEVTDRIRTRLDALDLN